MPPEKKEADKQTKRKMANSQIFHNASLAEEVALYYGFTPITAPTLSRDDLQKGKNFRLNRKKTPSEKSTISISPEEKIALLKIYEEKGWSREPGPAIIFIDGQFPGNPNYLPPGVKTCHLDIIGSGKPIAEAIVIKTAMEILSEEGFKDLYVDINSIGDKESVGRFTRELGAYLRKNAGELHSACREKLKYDPLEALNCEHQKCSAVLENAPKSLSYLNENGRQHFMEVLEFIESAGVPYRVDDQLIINHKIAQHTVFEIRSLNNETETAGAPLGAGLRYNAFGKRAAGLRDVPAIGATLVYKSKSRNKKNLVFKKPKICFVQIGFEAKLLGLKVIETLRRFKIPLYHTLSRDKLSAQINTAENMKIPYALIIGQKEAVEKSVIIRNMSNRSQQTIKIEELPAYLKKLKI
jgi:histidyl-tRNA synthetase